MEPLGQMHTWNKKQVVNKRPNGGKHVSEISIMCHTLVLAFRQRSPTGERRGCNPFGNASENGSHPLSGTRPSVFHWNSETSLQTGSLVGGPAEGLLDVQSVSTDFCVITGQKEGRSKKCFSFWT